MDFGTLKARVAEYLDRSDLETKIEGWINDCRTDIAIEYNFNYLYTEATCETSAGSARYALPADYLGHLVLWCGSKKLARIEAREAATLSSTHSEDTEGALKLETEGSVTLLNQQSEPDYYIDRGMEFELYPIPNGAYTLSLRYYGKPVDFIASGDEDYISRFHFEVIIFGASLRGAIFLDDEAKKASFEGAYGRAIQKMIVREKLTQMEDTHPRLKSYKDFDLLTFKRLMRVT